MLHENMEKIDDREFGIALKMVRYFHWSNILKISRSMYRELVGATAVRKSSKIKDIVTEFEKRM
jgi:hypothetical protein